MNNWIKQHCISCGVPVDTATGWSDDDAHEGAVSVCSACGNIALFNDRGVLRFPEADEYRAILADQGARRLLCIAWWHQSQALAGLN